jgi:RHS repeat-associated protein
MPSKIELDLPNKPAQMLANQTRNVAGLVTRRESVVASTTYDSDWGFDTFGRINSLVVSRGSNLAQLDLTYFGLDDPSSMTQKYTNSSVPGGINRTFTYSYDARHQLASTNESLNAFNSTYKFRPSGRFDHVTVAAQALPGSDVKPRDVYYEYNGVDPEAVSRLRNASDGTSFASYQYDTAGNLASRSYASPAQTWTFAYDGDDQLRRASLSGGGREEYYYDHNGSRVGIVKRDASNAVTEVRYFDGGDTEIWLAPDGTTKESYAYVSLGTPVARVTNATDFDLEFHSPLGNLLLSVDPFASTPGTTTAAFVYGPYAETIQSYQGSGSSNSNCGGIGAVPCHRRRFNDKYVDELDALSYYGVRYYDDASMSWTQADPEYRFAKDSAWGEPRRSNLYDFDLHRPSAFVDPDGRNALAIGGIVACGTSGVCEAIALVGSAAAVGYAIHKIAGAVNFSDPGDPSRWPTSGAGCGAGCAASSSSAAAATAAGLAVILAKQGAGSGAGSGASAPPPPPPTPPKADPASTEKTEPAPVPKRQSASTLRRKWEKAKGQPWPKDPKTGRNQDVSHKQPVGDGGDPNDPENYDPEPHDEHMDRHQRNGDFSRWGKRANQDAPADPPPTQQKSPS